MNSDCSTDRGVTDGASDCPAPIGPLPPPATAPAGETAPADAAAAAAAAAVAFTAAREAGLPGAVATGV